MRKQQISYGIDPDGYYVARYSGKDGCKLGFFVLDFEGMKPENGFQEDYNIDSAPLLQHVRLVNSSTWTRKIPVEIKNMFRKHFGLKPLKIKKEGE